MVLVGLDRVAGLCYSFFPNFRVPPDAPPGRVNQHDSVVIDFFMVPSPKEQNSPLESTGFKDDNKQVVCPCKFFKKKSGRRIQKTKI